MIAAVIAVASALALPMPAPTASAEPGCETVLWGFLGPQRRTLCDQPRRGAQWTRLRVIWTPAHQVPMTCSGRYYVTCWGGYFVGQSEQSRETYPVTDDTVLPDEPGYLR